MSDIATATINYDQMGDLSDFAKAMDRPLMDVLIEQAVRTFGHPHLEIVYDTERMQWKIQPMRGVMVTRA